MISRSTSTEIGTMASLQQEPTGVYHIVFRYDRKRFKRSLETKTQSLALARLDEIEETLQLLKSGRLGIPDDQPTDAFILAAGRIDQIKQKAPPPTESPRGLLLEGLFTEFFASLPDDNLEPNTLRTMHTHKQHLLRILKKRFPVADLKGNDLQKYVNARSKEFTQYSRTVAGKKKPVKCTVSATTIKKEIATFGTVWRWAATVPLLEGEFPSRGLRYPKADDKPPFQTYGEIVRQIETQSLTGSDASELWECLYLRKQEVEELLDTAEHRSYLPPYVFPMLASAAHTGARRSELLRARVADLDLTNRVLTIQEKKRVRGRRSTRRVPLSTRLAACLEKWLTTRAAGKNLFNASDGTSLTPDKVHGGFRNAVNNSKWQVIRGWHTLRHSFISNLACDGIDQRIIDDFVGHTTEEMRRRYRHLFPHVKSSAISKVFG
ncbi:MAG TPA: hypothetical protein DDW52_14335 [Planctomycetaceae bacterium]|nr:hypothetical protein [Planctomycetaceae bacterium]